MAFAVPLLGAALAGGGAAALGATAATAVAAAGTAFMGVSEIQKAGVQAQIARNNYSLALRNAASASDASQQEQLRSDREYAKLAGEQLAAQGASGLDILGQTQQLTRRTTATTRGMAASDIRRQGSNQVTGFFDDAMNAHLAGKTAATEAQAALGGMVLGLGRIGGNDPKLSKSMAGAARSVRRMFR